MECRRTLAKARRWVARANGPLGAALCLIVILDAGIADGDMTNWFGAALGRLAGIESPVLLAELPEGRASEVRSVIANGFQGSDWMLNARSLQKELSTIEWVRKAAVRAHPDGLIEVHIEERRPVAIHSFSGRRQLVDADGVPIGELSQLNAHELDDMVLLAGAGSLESFPLLRRSVGAFPAISSRLWAAVRAGERRWDLYLTGGLEVQLPDDLGAADRARAETLRASLARLEGLLQRPEIASGPVRILDLRHPDRYFIRANAVAVDEQA